MAVYFTGTSTGNKYEVGKSYQTGDGRVLTAQADGSFMKEGNLIGYTDAGKPMIERTGYNAYSVGSSQDRSTDWFADGKDAAAYTSQYRGSATSDAASGGSPTLAPATQGPAGSVRIPGPGTSSVATFANRGAFNAANGKDHPYIDMRRDNYAWSGKDDPSQDIKLGGYHARLPPTWSNGEVIEMAFGDNEVISTLYGMALIGATIGYNGRIIANEHGWDNGKGAARAVANALSPGSVGDAWDASMRARDNYVARDNADKAYVAGELDAWDARMELTQTEALKAGDWTAIPGVIAANEQRARNEALSQPSHGWINQAWGQMATPGTNGGW